MVSTVLLSFFFLAQGKNNWDSANRDTAESVLEVLNQAQMANQSRYNSGELTVVLRTGETDAVARENNLHELIQARVQWSDGRVRTDLTRWGPLARPPEGESLPLWRCCRRIGRCRSQNSPTIRAIRSREHTC